ncbi:MAG: hypothetical protein JWR13_5487 [Mycobacterium sp.]|jgi:hypothetical protein|nr:hypothetical protein [Mycobacterium sp.]MDT5311212.1 hypothetical protein [Mycobacterium sp.]
MDDQGLAMVTLSRTTRCVVMTAFATTALSVVLAPALINGPASPASSYARSLGCQAEGAAARVRTNVAPPPGVGATEMSPWWAMAISRTSASPMP